MPKITNKTPRPVYQPSTSTTSATRPSSNMPPVPAPRDTFIPGTNIPVIAKPNTPPAQPPKTVNVTGTLNFDGSFHQQTAGQLVAGGKLEVNYDLSRLSSLRHTHNGNPAWGVTAYVMYEPSGKIAEAPVMDFKSNYGRPTNEPEPRKATFQIPEGTTGVQVWFKNWTGADSPREAFDSNYGRNYRFDVQQPT